MHKTENPLNFLPQTLLPDRENSLTILIALMIWFWPTLLTLMGQRAYALGNNNKALRYLKAGHEHGRSGAVQSSAYAYILLRCGRAEEARVVANYALLNKRISDADKNQIRQILSLICYKQGDYVEAMEKLGAKPFVSLNTADFDTADALILP